ncbi:hypothetical protein BH23BAC1_BH23BAC1_05780 [soil metagenome]
MKNILLLICSLLAFAGSAYSQGGCPTDIKIETPAVPKPSQASLVSASCSTLVVKWQGSMGQTYEVMGAAIDPVTHQPTATAPATGYTCDKSFNCTDTIPVVAGTTVNWSVQALQEINGRTFYSYLSRSAEDLVVPDCETAESTKEMASNLYPNPVENLLHLNFTRTSENSVSGRDEVRITDLSGKIVLATQGNQENMQLNVGHLKRGIYLIRVTDGDGKMVYNARFIKQ